MPMDELKMLDSKQWLNAFNIQRQFKNKSDQIQTESFNLNANARKNSFTPA